MHLVPCWLTPKTFELGKSWSCIRIYSSLVMALLAAAARTNINSVKQQIDTTPMARFVMAPKVNVL